MRGNELLQELVGFGVLNCWITAALGLAWIVARVFHKRAAMRHLIRFSALMTLLAAPVIAYLSPPHYPLRMSLPASVSNVARSFVAPKQPIPLGDRSRIISDTTGLRLKTLTLPNKATNWRLVRISLVSLWLGGFLLFAIQPFIGLFALRRLYRNSEAGDPTGFNRSVLEKNFRLKRAWELRFDKTAMTKTAMTWGFVRPIILLPREATRWSEDRHQAVLLHELAHVQRVDSITQILSYYVCALYWFHPGVWLTASAMRQDAEGAADDTVLRSGVKPSVYAYELIQMATRSSDRPTRSDLVGVAFIGRSKIEARITAIVDKELDRRGVSWKGAQIFLAVSVFVVIATTTLRPSVSVWVRPEKPRLGAETHRLLPVTRAISEASSLHPSGRSYGI